MLLPELMLGAVAPSGNDSSGQAFPVTAHWREPAGGVVWLAVRGGPLSAEVSGAQIELRSDNELVLEYSDTAAQIGASSWTVGGRHIESRGIHATAPAASRQGSRCVIRLPSGHGRLVFA
jgi:hypothetical protein